MMNDLHLLLPFPSRINPGATAAGRGNLAWARRVGLTQDVSRMRALEATAPHDAAARMFPDASPADLELMTGYLSWLFLLDDELDSGTGQEEAALSVLPLITAATG